MTGRKRRVRSIKALLIYSLSMLVVLTSAEEESIMENAEVLTPCHPTYCVDNQSVISNGFKSYFYADTTTASDGKSAEIMIDLKEIYSPRSLFLINTDRNDTE